MVALLLTVLLLGPAETIAGKYARASAPAAPLPAPLPDSSEALCGLIESGHATADLFAALGEALLREGDGVRAYRVFHRACRLRPDDTAWGRAMVQRKDACGTRVPDATIRAEEREAEVWAKALQDWRAEGGGDLETFYERYGRPEDNIYKVVRARQFSWAGGVAGILIGAGFVLASRLVARRAALLPLAVGVACLLGPSVVGQRGLFVLGGVFAFAGAAAVLLLGRKGGVRGHA